MCVSAGNVQCGVWSLSTVFHTSQHFYDCTLESNEDISHFVHSHMQDDMDGWINQSVFHINVLWHHLRHCIPPCLAAWHWRSLSWPPPAQRKISASGLSWMQGLQEGRGLWPVIRNHCRGSSVGGGHWEVRGQGSMGPCPEAALEY